MAPCLARGRGTFLVCQVQMVRRRHEWNNVVPHSADHSHYYNTSNYRGSPHHSDTCPRSLRLLPGQPDRTVWKQDNQAAVTGQLANSA